MNRNRLLLMGTLVTLSFLYISCAAPKYATVTPELHTQFMNDLKAGKPNLDCDTLECDLSWIQNLKEMSLLYNSKEWEKLAELVMKVGYGKDLGYYFLGQAAEGMGYKEAALKYYNQSITVFSDSRKLHHCRESGGGCRGLDLSIALPQRVTYVQKAIQATSRQSITRDNNKINGGEKFLKKGNTREKKPITSKVTNNLEINGYLLKNGEYKDDDPDHPEDYVSTGISDETFGDLNGDGVSDGAVVMYCNHGGSGIMLGIAAILAASGNPIVTKVIPLGEKVEVRSMKIEHGTIILSLLTHGPRDGLCCPTVKSVCKFKLEGNRLVNLTPKVLKNESQDTEGFYFEK